ncbi:MAG TPA: hypothetical protein VND96_02705 [Candidatus Micrarchaeaceae archaeon]|nr:hypothetical protein [Candidatus Micrarchaeaceae archaeon]
MTPEERELKRALEARSGEVTPQFRARLSSALSEGRPASNFLPALAAVAAVVLLLVSVGVLLLARQSRNQPPPVAAVSTPTPAASPVPTPTPPSKAVALHPESVTFISPEVGLVIGLSPCGSAQCLRLAKTVDAGLHWTWVTANLSGISPAEAWRLRFADAENGWISGPLLFATHDGGRTWTRIALPHLGSPGGSVSALEAADGYVFAEVDEDNALHTVPSPFVLFSSSVSSNSWTAVANVAHGSAGSSHEISIAQGIIWVLQGSSRLYKSSDGVSWHSAPMPCPASDSFGTSFGAATSSRVFIVCGGSGYAGGQGKTAYVSSNGGASYQQVADPPMQGQIEEAAGSPTAFAIAALSGASWIYTSFNDGHSWATTTLTETFGPSASDAPLSDLGFTTATQGVVIVDGQLPAYPQYFQLLMTRDGGHTWKAVVVSPS